MIDTKVGGLFFEIGGDNKELKKAIKDSEKETARLIAKFDDLERKGFIAPTKGLENMRRKVLESGKALIGLEDQWKQLISSGKAFEESVTLKVAKKNVKNLTEELAKLKSQQADFLASGTVNDELKNSYETRIGATTRALTSAEENLQAIYQKGGWSKLTKEASDLQESIRATKEEAKKFQEELRSAEATGSNFKRTEEGLKNLNAQFEEVTKSAQDAEKATQKVGNNNGLKLGLKNVLAYAFGIRSLFSLFSMLRRFAQEGFGNLLNSSESTKAKMDDLRASVQMLKNSLGAMVAPIFEIIAPALSYLAELVASIFNKIATFVGFLTGKGIKVAKKTMSGISDGISNIGGSAGGASSALKELRRQLMGFDQIQKLDEIEKATGGGGSGVSYGGGLGVGNIYEDMFEEIDVDTAIQQWREKWQPVYDAIAESIENAKLKITELTGFDFELSENPSNTLIGNDGKPGISDIEYQAGDFDYETGMPIHKTDLDYQAGDFDYGNTDTPSKPFGKPQLKSDKLSRLLVSAEVVDVTQDPKSQFGIKVNGNVNKVKDEVPQNEKKNAIIGGLTAGLSGAVDKVPNGTKESVLSKGFTAGLSATKDVIANAKKTVNGFTADITTPKDNIPKDKKNINVTGNIDSVDQTQDVKSGKKKGWAYATGWLNDVTQDKDVASGKKKGWAYATGWLDEVTEAQAVKSGKTKGWAYATGWINDVTETKAVEKGDKRGWAYITGWIDEVEKTKNAKVKFKGSLGKGSTAGEYTMVLAKQGGIFSAGNNKSLPQGAHGSLVWAGESGPEILGHFNGKTEIINRSQIASTIASGVSRMVGRLNPAPQLAFVERQMAQQQSTNTQSAQDLNSLVKLVSAVLVAVQNKDNDVYFDTVKVTNEVVKQINRDIRATGVSPIIY